jgi:poly-gamma-glutamate synthesis protein (capsule biosynthesis protein)
MRRLLLAPVLLLALPLAGAVALLIDRDPATAPQPADETTPAASASPAPSPTPSPSPAVQPLTLAEVFSPRDISHLDPARLVTVIATGDVIPARYTDVVIRQRGDDFLYPVAATKDITSAADLTVVNLEAPLVDYCPYHDEGFTFCGRPGFVKALEAAGVDVVTLENNHIGNYGLDGIAETKTYFQPPHVSFPIAWADRESPAIVDVKGLRFGVLAFNAVLERVDRDAMVAEIRALRPQVDVLAVAFHWGAEYVSVPGVAPGVADDDPVDLAHLAVDAGADWIIGNHPHWVQAVELYRNKFIAYAHGNFIFDQMWSYETRVGVIGKYTFYDACLPDPPLPWTPGRPSCPALVRVEFIPTLIEDWAQPAPMSGAEAQAVLDGMRAASEKLAARFSGLE